MKRNVFLTIAAILAVIFGSAMTFTPDKMIQNMATASDPSSLHVLQWAGNMLLTIGLINFLSRNDAGSPALRAVMIGNIFLHAGGLIVDWYHYSIGFVNVSGLATGMVVHVLLIIGFVYYLGKMNLKTA
jgi:hypothetical protein